MSVYARFKKSPEGFRALVELLESTPVARRQKMIEVGMAEDPAYTEQALKCMMNFEDILGLEDVELVELVATAQPRIIAYAIHQASPEIKTRFLRCAKPPVLGAIRDCLEDAITTREIGGAQLTLVTVARKLERQGLIQAKKIPA